MTIATVPMYDATRTNIPKLPHGQHAGYSTGSGPVPWTAAQFAADPAAVQIDQSPVNTALDEMADVLDYEAGAATLADIAPWATAAEANYHSAARPGQRFPAVYMSRSNVTAVVNALVAGKVSPGVGLGIADWGLTQAQATALVATSAGPWLVVWVQFKNNGAYDSGVVSVPWLNARSSKPGPAPFRVTAPPPGRWKAGTVLTARGTGTDGRPYSTSTRNGATWTQPAEG